MIALIIACVGTTVWFASAVVAVFVVKDVVRAVAVNVAGCVVAFVCFCVVWFGWSP